MFGKPRVSLRCFFSVLKLCLTTEIWKQGTMGPVSAEREEKNKRKQKTLSVFATLQLLTMSDVLENADHVVTLVVLLKLCVYEVLMCHPSTLCLSWFLHLDPEGIMNNDWRESLSISIIICRSTLRLRVESSLWPRSKLWNHYDLFHLNDKTNHSAL